MTDRIVVLTGGVGGAKLVLGLSHVVAPQSLTAIVNTGDDFRHLGLWVSPDIDTLLYTLSGRANQKQGWGREGESWNFMAALRSLGGEDWFQLGDGDLALHVIRSMRLAQGTPLAAIVRDFARAWDIPCEILPMSNSTVSTQVVTQGDVLDFQHYFVARRCEPVVKRVHFEGANAARPCEGVVEAISSPDTRAILIAPSNPYLSIDPILAVPGIAEAIRSAPAPVVAVTPIVKGAAIKGPTAKIMQELGVAVTPAAIAAHYGDLLDGILVDERDARVALPIATAYSDTLMTTLDDRKRVARAALALAQSLRGK